MRWLLLACLLLAGPARADGLQVALGKALFDRPWAAAGASNTASDGLGPLMTARACVNCHPRGRGGRLPELGGQGLVLRLLDDPNYGRQLQTNAIHGHAAEGALELTWEARREGLGDGTAVSLRRPSWQIQDAAYGPPPVLGSLRLAPDLHGMGALAAIPQSAIDEAAAAPKPDGVKGKVAGRFGLRGAHTSLESQIAEAFFLDLGLATLAHPEPWGDCTPAQRACLNSLHGADEGGAEIDQPIVSAIAAYLVALPVPTASRSADPRGLALFQRTGCSACHLPSLGGVATWSDLLVHDMGDGLADAMGPDWRTAPLWGLGQRLAADQPLLHDGRARSVTEAVLWHGGEAAAAKARFLGLNRADRQRLLRFVEGL